MMLRCSKAGARARRRAARPRSTTRRAPLPGTGAPDPVGWLPDPIARIARAAGFGRPGSDGKDTGPRAFRYERFGGIAQLGLPRSLVFVDRDRARALGHGDGGALWRDPEPR